MERYRVKLTMTIMRTAVKRRTETFYFIDSTSSVL